MKILNRLLENHKNLKEVSEELNISKNAVYGWIREEKRHPSNENTEKLIIMLKRKNEDVLKEILIKEIQEFQQLVLKL